MLAFRLIVSICLISFLYHERCPALILKISSLDNFKKEVLELDAQALVIFDVDETLINPKDPFFRDSASLPNSCQNILQHFEMDLFLNEEILKNWKEFWISKIFLKMEFQLVDHDFPLILHGLQQKKN
jgi:hypothetical protein